MNGRAPVWLWAGALGACLAAPLGAQTVRGTVVDAATLAPVAGASLRLLAPDSVLISATLTANDGSFLLSGRPGDYELVVDRIGYESDREPVRLRAGGFVELTVSLETHAIPLDTLRVDTRPRAMVNSGYYDRKAQGFGQFLEHAQFMKWDPHSVGDVLRHAQGVRIDKQRGFADVVMGGTFLEKRSNCLPMIWLNGAPVTTAYNWSIRDWGDRRFNLDDLPADQVEAVEVYAFKSSAPVQFLKSDSECGTVLIWTRPAR